MRNLCRKHPITDEAAFASVKSRMSRTIVSAFTAAVLVYGCGDTPTQPTLNPELPARELSAAGPKHRTIDNDFEDLATLIPGFGGLYFDRQANLRVFLTDKKFRATAVIVLESFFGTRSVRLAKGKTLNVAGLIVEAGQYDWKALTSYSQRLVESGRFRGINRFDIDESLNRLVIDVSDEKNRRRTINVLESANVPLQAVIVRVMPGELDFSHSLLAGFRPVIGGIAIDWYDGVANPCTLGIPVRRSGAARFMTAAHCSAQPHVASDSTPMFQPYYDPAWSFFIGRRNLTAPTFTNAQDNRCPVTYNCRWSDAALSAYAAGITDSLGRIARTETSGQWSGSILINHAAPTWRITQEAQYPFVGEQLNKVGQTTGWTQGFVTADCANFYSADQGVLYLCQGEIEAGADQGDSGAPVFGIITGGDVRFLGIVRGGVPNSYFSFSPVDGIEYELGLLTTF